MSKYKHLETIFSVLSMMAAGAFGYFLSEQGLTLSMGKTWAAFGLFWAYGTFSYVQGSLKELQEGKE